ncbi:MAG: hypothetical protein PWP59_2232, partial [Sphaerochaeta sp.]|nr:hypothetical protein [Sphaerochaeta sp.]
VSRSEAAGLLNLRPDQQLEGPGEDTLPVVRLYRSFLRRNALARLRREKGPHRTLEQYLLLYLWQRRCLTLVGIHIDVLDLFRSQNEEVP